MTEIPPHVFSGEEIKAIKFAVRRQLRRWRGRELDPERQQWRADLAVALQLLEEFPAGCELRKLQPAGEEQPAASTPPSSRAHGTST